MFLLASNHSSPQIMEELKEGFFTCWHELLDIKPKEMDEETRLVLSMAFSCIISILGELSPVFSKSPEKALARLEALSQLPQGEGRQAAQSPGHAAWQGSGPQQSMRPQGRHQPPGFQARIGRLACGLRRGFRFLSFCELEPTR